MNASEKRMAVRDKYKLLLGRNKYSQSLRRYVNTKYKGSYYSDCSSSVSWAYKAAGYPITYGGTTLPSTVGLYNSKDLQDVPVKISKGQIANSEVLRVGDLLLFAGTDKSRAGSGYVGHVEMVASIASSGKITIYGHGSGTPRETEMTAYLKKRYGQKTSTSLGHKGLIKVRRRIPDDGSEPKELKLGDRVLCNGMTGADVKELQETLISLGYSCGSYGADGDFGGNTESAVRTFQQAHELATTGIADAATIAALKQTRDPASEAQPVSGPCVTIVNCAECNIRTGPGAEYASVGTAKCGDVFAAPDTEGWTPVIHEGATLWISKKYTKVVEP